MSQDASELHALFTNDKRSAPAYADVKWSYIEDTGSGVNTGNATTIKFDNKNLMSVITTLEDAYITVPMKIESSTTTKWTNQPGVAFKHGTVSLFTQVQWSTATGTNITQDNMGPYFINPIRQLIEMNTLAQNGLASEMCYAPDQVAAVDANTNAGFLLRTSTFASNFVWNATDGCFNGEAIVKLRDLHDVFRQIRFPMINLNWHLTLTFAYPINSASQYAALDFQTHADQTTAAPPKVTIGINGSGKNGECRLYMKQISLEGPDWDKVNAALPNGIRKEVRFLETEVYINNTVASNPISWQISPSSNNVRRVWIFGLPKSKGQDMKTLVNGVVKFKTADVKVNQQSVRDMQYTKDIEFFNALKEQVRGGGLSWQDAPLVNFQQFTKQLGVNRYYCWDLSRRGKRLSLEQPIALNADIVYGRPIDDANARDSNGKSLNADPTVDAQKIDLICVIEKEVVANFNISSSFAAVTKIG